MHSALASCLRYSSGISAALEVPRVRGLRQLMSSVGNAQKLRSPNRPVRRISPTACLNFKSEVSSTSPGPSSSSSSFYSSSIFDEVFASYNAGVCMDCWEESEVQTLVNKFSEIESMQVGARDVDGHDHFASTFEILTSAYSYVSTLTPPQLNFKGDAESQDHFATTVEILNSAYSYVSTLPLPHLNFKDLMVMVNEVSCILASSEPKRPLSIENAHPERLDEALSRGSVGFSFSGGGFLLPYYLGNIQALSSLGLLKPGSTHIGGSSAGSLAAAIVACGLSMDQVLPSVRALMADCREKGVYRRLAQGLKSQLEELLPADAHVRCSGTVHIGVTQVHATYGSLRSKHISHFATREELIEALMASCHLPLLSDGSLTTRYRGRTVIDGGFTDMMPVPSQPHHVVKITCFPLENIERMPMRNKGLAQQHISLSPCRFRKWPHSADETLKFAMSPGPDDFVDFLLEAGQEDIMSWIKSANVLPASAASMRALPLSKRESASGGDVRQPGAEVALGQQPIPHAVVPAAVATCPT